MGLKRVKGYVRPLIRREILIILMGMVEFARGERWWSGEIEIGYVKETVGLFEGKFL
jgi:hypothetical protein